jgi:SAM-dependent methyltransferase
MTGAGARCRVCGARGLEVVLDLGATPLANRLLTDAQLAEKEPTYPLTLAFCSDCSLVQILETVPPDTLFREYAYFTSVSETMLRHAAALAERLVRTRGLGPNSLVVELASNDGYLLQHFVRAGIPVLGVEPAANVARAAAARGVRTLTEFFDAGLARRLRDAGEAADVIVANNVLAHVADLDGFVEGLRILLERDGVAVIEVPYVRDLIDRVEFDTIYHEHLCYFSLTALDRLFRGHELAVEDVERIPVHGGSLRLVVGLPGIRAPAPAVDALRDDEAKSGVDTMAFYRVFADEVTALRDRLRRLLQGLKRDGQRLAAYGAAAKGAMLLSYCGIGRETLDFVVDRSPYKQGRYLPGTRLPICAPARLIEAMPDYVLLLSWNVADEVMAQQEEYRRRGGRFIVPVPTPRIV